MELASIEHYTGIPYCERTFDCADLVILVQRELFGRDVHLPGKRLRGLRGATQVGDLSRQFARRTDAPRDGDLVLMIEHARPAHVGVYFWLAHEAWVLHTNERNGCSVLHRMRDLPEFGVIVEGVYAWYEAG